MAKLSLAEQISQLANPKPKDVDIENFEDRDDGSESEGDVDYDSDLATEHYVKVGKSKLRDDAPALNPKYKAGTVSRKALYDDESEDGDGADGFIDEDDDEEEDEDDEDSEEEGEGNGFIDDEAEDDEEEEEEEEDEDEDMEDQAEEDESDEELSENENDSSARATLKELLREEKKAAKQQAKEATVSDAQKGFAIQKQTDLYETLLDARITFQKAVQSSNALPISEVKAEELGEDNSSTIQDTKAKLSDFISQIAKMRYNMAVQDKVFGADDVKLSTKRTFEATLDNMEKLDSEFKTYETSVLTKWSQKVQASSAASALNSSKFKALNQSSANQVAATLADMDRLVKRTRMNRSNVVILGEEQMGAIQNAEGENYYVFDDSDFYRNLLKDLIDRRMVDSGSQSSSGVKTWTATKAKTKKVVDTRASKGRKLRYHVQDKVQNFAAPRPVFTWEDDQIDELFAGLLGQRVNFNEDDDGEDKKDDEEDNEEDKLVIPDDGLRIFG
ncbi:Protein BFR2 [Yarrowia sp. C11]|nr:Protein BFR2 [Yarrowia sp. C11]